MGAAAMIRKPKLRYNYPPIKGDNMLFQKHHLNTSFKGSILLNVSYLQPGVKPPKFSGTAETDCAATDLTDWADGSGLR